MNGTRIVIVGDLQYKKDETIDSIIRDLNTLSPDAVVLLGDYGYWTGFGSYEVFSQIAEKLKGISCKTVIPLLGNHDLQWEAGERNMKSGTVAANYRRAFGFSPENRVLEFDDFRIFCIHMDSPTKEVFCSQNECYISDEHFETIKAELEKYPDKPAIMLTHAPPVGCGLLTVPMVHIRYSNAYLEQDHNPQRWADLAREYRQIILWFSGHYHMGHHHKDSMSVRDGLAYFVTGAATAASRDGQKHSRVVDVENGEIKVFTYDHDAKRLLVRPDYTCHAQLRNRVSEKRLHRSFSAGCGRVVPDGLKCGANGRVYAMTDDGFLWEIDVENEIAAGTLHYSDEYRLDGIIVDKDYIWRVCGDKIFGHRYDDINRYMREKDYDRCRCIVKCKQEAPVDLGETFMHDGRLACRISDGKICTTYNDAEGRLYFEVVKI